MCDEVFYELAKAIILQAVVDFKPAWLQLKRHPDDEQAADRVKEITGFFRSEYFCLLSDMDGLRLLKQIIAQLDRKGKMK